MENGKFNKENEKARIQKCSCFLVVFIVRYKENEEILIAEKMNVWFESLK